MITPEQFFEKWLTVTSRYESAIKSNWSKKEAYTTLFVSHKDCIIRDIANELKFECKKEYYSIDAVLYNSQSRIIAQHIPIDFLILKEIEIAFEHEDNCKKSYEELAHFLITNSSLNVLVTYLHNEYYENILNEHEAIIKSTKNFEKFKYLLIFGTKSKEENIIWEAYKHLDGFMVRI